MKDNNSVSYIKVKYNRCMKPTCFVTSLQTLSKIDYTNINVQFKDALLNPVYTTQQVVKPV